MHEPVGRVQFVVFEKFTSAYLFQISREKSFDYFLIIYMGQFLSRFSTLRDKWSVTLLQLYWKKIWHVNSSVMYENWAVSFNCAKQISFIVNWRTWPQSKTNLPAALMWLSLQLFVEWLKKKLHYQARIRWEVTLQPSTTCFNQNAEKQS